MADLLYGSIIAEYELDAIGALRLVCTRYNCCRPKRRESFLSSRHIPGLNLWGLVGGRVRATASALLQHMISPRSRFLRLSEKSNPGDNSS